MSNWISLYGIMDFFQHQEKAKSRTFFLIFLYSLGLAGLAMTIGAFLLIFSPDPAVLLCCVSGVIALVLLGSLFKTAQLSSGGGKAVAESLGGTPVSPSTTDPAQRRLYNVVEEMALAAGVPMPALYMMTQEKSINAFAAGFSPNSAVIGVNRGTVELLTRDELQGVIAHEFSHILNGDMRMNMRLIGILFGLQILAIIGYYVMRIASFVPRSNNKGGAGAVALFIIGGIALMIIGYIGVFFSSIIQAAISRQREFLADASAVQFTRNPAGIAGALKKIGCPNVGSQMISEHAAETSHLFFGNACGLFSFGNLLATHPDLTTRIKRIDPQFDGRYPKQIAPIRFTPEASPAANSLPKNPSSKTPSRESILNNIGNINIEGILTAGAMLDALPQHPVESASDPLTAQAVFYAMLIDSDDSIRNRQYQHIQELGSAFLDQETQRLVPQMGKLSEEEKIPLAQRVSSALRTMTKTQYQRFSQTVDKLIAADQKMNLFEYTLKAILLRDLDIHFGLAKQLGVRYNTLAQVHQPISAVLSYLAYAGHSESASATGAFSTAMQELKLPPVILPAQEATIQRFDQSLRILAETAPALKKQIFSALMTCVWYDKTLSPQEAGLIWAIAAMLAIPMPVLTDR